MTEIVEGKSGGSSCGRAEKVTMEAATIESNDREGSYGNGCCDGSNKCGACGRG